MIRERIKVLLVDENGFERQALHGFLEEFAGADVVAEAEDASDVLAALENSTPDVVIIDLPYDLEAALSLVRTVRALHPELPVMIVSNHREQVFADHALEAGATGYVHLHEVARQLPAAIDKIRAGGHYISVGA